MTHKPLQLCLWAVYVALRLKSQLVCLGAVSPSLGSHHLSPATRHSSQPALAGQACLQNRLNELGQNIAIEIREW